MDKKELLNRLFIAEKYFKGTKYQPAVDLARYSFTYLQDYNNCEEALNHLPTEKQLLEALVGKLKGKSVYRTLRKMQEGKLQNNLTTLKGLSSLLTHTVIEAEKKPEFKLLIPSILNNINEVAFNV